MTIHMGTTSIAPEQSIAEITRLLVAKGASAIASRYVDGVIHSVQFIYHVNEQPLSYELPCKLDGAFAYLQAQRSPRARERHLDQDMEQAARTAWRIQLRWVQAQIAQVELQQAKIEEVFLPYLLIRGKTLYSLLEASKFNVLALSDQRVKKTLDVR